MAVETWERSGAELAERIRGKRDKHLVVISQRTDTDLLHLDVDYIGGRLEGYADVLVVRDRHITWELSRMLPQDWSVYGNSARAYPAELHTGAGRPTRYVVALERSERQSRAEELIALVEYLPVPPALKKDFSAKHEVNRDQVVRSGTVAGFLGGGERALIEFEDGVRGILRQDDVVPGVRLDWLLETGQEVGGSFDPVTRTFRIEPGATVPRRGQAYQWNDLVLCLVESADPESAALAVLPGQSIRVSLEDLSSNPMDRVDELLTPGQVVVARLWQDKGATEAFPCRY